MGLSSPVRQLAIAMGVALCAGSHARAQGLKDIGPLFDDEVRLPFSFSIASAAGWDSRPGAGSSTGDNDSLPSDGGGSGFWQNSFDIHYPVWEGRHRFTIDANFSNTWYFDPPVGTQEFNNAGGLDALYTGQIDSRLTIGNNLHVIHQTEPDFSVGTSINRPTSGYFSGSNRLWAIYKLSNRFSAETSFTASGISYDDEEVEDENNFTGTFSEKLRYALTLRTTATLEYRYSFSQYPDNPAADSTSNFILIGVDRPLGRFLSMSLSGGEEFRSYDGPLGERTAPYAQAAINYRARENTTFRLYYRSGLETTGRAGRQSNSSRRMGLELTHRFTPRLSFNMAVDSIQSDFSGGGATGLLNSTEDTLHASLGLHYSRPLWRRFNFDANYTYAMVDSDEEAAEYQRHRVSMGVSARF